MVVLVALILDINLRGQDQETVCKTLGDKELPVIVAAEFNACPPAIRVGTRAEIDTDIEDAAGHTADQLGLRVCLLEVETTQNTLGRM